MIKSLAHLQQMLRLFFFVLSGYSSWAHLYTCRADCTSSLCIKLLLHTWRWGREVCWGHHSEVQTLGGLSTRNLFLPHRFGSRRSKREALAGQASAVGLRDDLSHASLPGLQMASSSTGVLLLSLYSYLCAKVPLFQECQLPWNSANFNDFKLTISRYLSK